MRAQRWPRSVPVREKRWNERRVVFDDERPRCLYLGTAAQDLFLVWTYVSFCRVPRTNAEIAAWLQDATTCPPGLIDALERTLFERSFRYFGRGRLVDRQPVRIGDDRRIYTTESGVEWLESYKDTVGGLGP